MSDPDPQSPSPPDTPIEIGELRAVSNLLRDLPDPELPEDLRERVMAQVAQEPVPGERGLLHGFFGKRQPAFAAALAAGFAGVFFILSGQNEPGNFAHSVVPNVAGTSERAGADKVRRVSSRPTPSQPAMGFSSAPVVPTSPQAFFAPDLRFVSSSVPAPRSLPPLDRRLDRQIDQMLHEPNAFFRRIEHIRENERYLARLAERSARRGDSAAIALRVRNTQHPLAPQVAERFLRASLAQSLSKPQTRPAPSRSTPSVLPIPPRAAGSYSH